MRDDSDYNSKVLDCVSHWLQLEEVRVTPVHDSMRNTVPVAV